ncbi:3'(2'),5'-bisphosphate nucleotidase [Ranunculus cassubicifolius]
MAGIVIIFDFDKTIVDCDSDNHVLDDLGATDLFEELLLTMPWNAAMDTMMNNLHSQGRTIQEIEDSLKRVPVDPKAISAIKSAHALGCDLRIVSDANTFFIETVLKYHGLLDYFSEINTNPGFLDEEGRLRIQPYHDITGCSHASCPPNMCKGLIIDRIKSSALAEGERRFIYLGDGKGDFCPMTKFREEDFVMPRKGYPVWELICSSNPSMIKAEIHEWSNWDDQERILVQLIVRIIYQARVPSIMISSDQHFQTISIPSPLPLKLAV